MTVNVCPATVSVPLRAEPLFDATVNPTVPEPLPLAADVMVIHDTPLVAVQAQPDGGDVVTAIGVPAPPPPAMDCEVGAI